MKASCLFTNLALDIAHPAHYVIKGNDYNMSNYLADVIYPKWSTLIQTIHNPRDFKKKLFVIKQKVCQKDVERTFEVLQ